MRLALGTVQFGSPYGVANKLGQVSLSAAESILNIASSNDINTLDTAIDYGDSEVRLGKIGLSNFKLVTKLPKFPDGCDIANWTNSQVNDSFLRLGVDNIYGLLLHRPEQLLGLDGPKIYRSLESLKEKGLVEKIGVSISSPKELDVLIPNFRFDLVQAPLNLIDRRLINTGWMKRLKDAGVEIHTRSSFLQGLLLIKQAEIPSKFLQWNGLWKQWHHWLLDSNISALQASLSFSLSFPEIDQVIVGVNSSDQLLEIISASRNTLKNNLPNLASEDENLINPSNWLKL